MKQNVRASADSEVNFRFVLQNMRCGINTEDDWKLLQTRWDNNFSASYKENYNVYLAYSNETVAKHNYKKLKSLNKTIFKINAKHSSTKASHLSINDFGGFEPILYLSKGARVMLTRNLWTEHGLCNGSMGIVTDIIYKEGDAPPALPIAVIVKFDC